MTSRIDGQTDEQAEGDAIGSGKSGLERVLGLAQRRSSPQFEDARRCSRHKRLDSPPGGVQLVREEPGGVAGRRSYGKCRFSVLSTDVGMPHAEGPGRASSA